MVIRSKLQQFGRRVGEYYSGLLYEERKSLLFRFLGRALSKAKAGEEDLEKLKTLSHQGVVVHALKNQSQLNCLILRNVLTRGGLQSPVYCHNINMLLWQPFRHALRAIISQRFHNPFLNNYIKRITKQKLSSVIYLRGSAFLSTQSGKDPLGQLIDAQREMDAPVFLVPQLVAYGRRREKKDKSLADLLFSQTENPGTLRRIVTFFRYQHKAFVVSSQPVNLSEFLETHRGKPRETISYLLRREIIDRIDTEKRAIVGPVIKSREEIVEIALRDPGLVQFMEEMTVTDKEGYDAVVDKAKKYLLEIAAGCNETYIGFADRALTWMWNNIYDGVIVDKEGIARMREVVKKMPFVVIPCHRSHISVSGPWGTFSGTWEPFLSGEPSAAMPCTERHCLNISRPSLRKGFPLNSLSRGGEAGPERW